MAIQRLPELLEKNAPAMMRRIVAHMKSDMAQGDTAGKVSHGGLFLKVGEEDLVREFLAAIREAFAAKQDALDIGMALSLEAENGNSPAVDFATSNAAFASLCKSAAPLGLEVERYRSDAFVAAMENTFQRSRMDARATEELMPFARSALNGELRALYIKLDQLATRGSAAG